MKYVDTANFDDEDEEMMSSRNPNATSSSSFNSGLYSTEEQKKQLLIPTLDLTGRNSKARPPAFGNKLQSTNSVPNLNTMGDSQGIAYELERKEKESFDATRAESSPATNILDGASLSQNVFETFTKEQEEAHSKRVAMFNGTSTSVTTFPEPGPEVKAILDAIAGRQSSLNKDEYRKKVKERVIAQAFNRCLDEVEDSAKLEDLRRYEERKMYETWKNNELAKKEQAAKEMSVLKDALDSQIELTHTQNEKDRLEQKNKVSKFFLSDKAGKTPSPYAYDENGNPVDRRKRVAEALKTQISENMARSHSLKEDTIRKEKEYLDRLKLEDELQAVIDRKSHLERQKGLLEAWERDGHVRNLKKLQAHGNDIVKDYIDRNFADTMQTMNTFAPTLNQSLNMSIGYDVRKGKF
jgi:hypothetical protein